MNNIAQLGEPVLAEVASYVRDFGDDLQQLVKRMQAEMQRANGVGIAAPQIFVSQRVIIIASRPSARYPDAPEMAPLVLVNPEMVAQGSEQELGWEGCLSVPGLRGNVRRFSEVGISYQDLQGNSHNINLSGFLARIAQHELAHLDGKTFVDQVETRRDLVATSVWERQCQ